VILSVFVNPPKIVVHGLNGNHVVVILPNSCGIGMANKERTVRRAARCSGGFKSLWLSDEESHIQRRG
jgi:hypothetical protein